MDIIGSNPIVSVKIKNTKFAIRIDAHSSVYHNMSTSFDFSPSYNFKGTDTSHLLISAPPYFLTLL